MLDKKRPGRLTCLFFMGALLGGIAFILIFGVRILDGSYIDRMLIKEGVEDLPQHYLGWEFFRRSAWSFPLGDIKGLVYPDTISAVYADSITLFAVVFKLFSAVLPDRFQYFGIFSLLCFMLQGGFASLICDRFFKKAAVSLILSLFFIISPCMIKRAFYHTSLTAHFLILAAFAIWLYKSGFKSWKTPVFLFAALNALSVTIHPYFIAITVGITLCYALQELLENKWTHTLLLIGTSATAVLATAWAFGYFASGTSAPRSGLGRYSFNLSGFLNPLWYSGFFAPHPVYAGTQIEGFAYLGFGMICLLAIALVLFILRQRDRIKRTGKFFGFSKNSIPVLVMAAVFTVLAVSPVVTFQDMRLFSIPVPDYAFRVLSVFRASGRFIWPVYYAVYIFAIREIALWYQKSKPADKKARKITGTIGMDLLISLIIAAAAFVQVCDLTPLFVEKNLLVAEEAVYQTRLQSPVWEELAKTHRHIYFYKPTSDIYDSRDCQSTVFDFADYALDHNMDINVICIARLIKEAKDDQITAHFDTMAQGAVYNDYLYVFMNPDYFPGDGYGLHYYKIDGILIGVNTSIDGIREYNA